MNLPTKSETAGGCLDLQFTDAAVTRLGSKPDAVIPILQALQEHYGYLPEEALRRVCEASDITPAAINGVASFYDMFRFSPVGKHLVRVCTGTACHVAGAGRVEDALRRHLRIPAGGDTDADRQFTIEQVACLGCCTLAPVVKIGDTTFGHTTPEKVPDMIRDYLASAASATAVKSTEERLARSGNCGSGAGVAEIHVGLGSCCMAKGSDRLFHALRENAEACGGSVVVKRVGCVGMCHRTPMIEVAQAGKPGTFYADLTPAQARALVQRHFRPRGFLQRASRLWTRAVDSLLLEDSSPQQEVQRFSMSKRDPNVRAFLDKQVHIATEHFGQLDPLDLDEYLAHGGFGALAKCLGVAADGSPPDSSPGTGNGGALPSAATPEQIISTIEKSGLRGRGGAGFPTGQKWRVVSQQPGETKYVICNGDEGDPGAFMDRMILESFPYRVIEGLALAALAVGAHEGVFYIRHEYPLAVKRVRAAIAELEKRGWLGERLLGAGFPLTPALSPGERENRFQPGSEAGVAGSVTATLPLLAHTATAGKRGVGASDSRTSNALREPSPLPAGEGQGEGERDPSKDEASASPSAQHLRAFPLKLSVFEGAGAFVCGEETALIASVEGHRGMPRLRPPFPAQSGLWGKPTLINNVETLAMVPWIVRHGAEKFAAIGTAKSKGTKVFALAGKIQRGGLIEIPMGTTVREIVEDIGGGVGAGRRLKAVQIGGPSGGCVPARLADTSVDFESLREIGAIMGSGGLVVLDDTACMVDIARYFLQFTQDQSCGKCTFCRIGTKRMLDILERLCIGKASRQHLDELERLAVQVGAGSLCGLGKTAPNPVLTTLRYFRDEYEAHLAGRCPAGKCTALIHYRVTADCTGCTLCSQACPVDAIPMTPYRRHEIDDAKCTRCDTCRVVCPHSAIEVK
jgi:NADH:ubiquinone oxidoreductase subunit F (NADH-binding)/NADH:ubiquinone oxidoreductase subunit E/Pyruvate/2-oxoacid:ferredoxin oxidoreductase delta subunit